MNMPAYNYFPMGYQQYQYAQPQFQQPIQPVVQQPSQSSNGTTGIIWVQGEAGAKSYLVAPNTTVQLWDSESQTIYLKSADASGMPSIKTLDYTIRELSNPSVSVPQVEKPDLSNYVTKEELEEKLNSFRNRQQRKDNRNE
jgi:hypothetical protein